MKISIDGILGSAKKISGQKQHEDNEQDKKKKGIKGDSINISKRIDSRLGKIEKEFRDVQSSLTKNQIIRDGIEKVEADFQNGGKTQREIFDTVKFEDENVLSKFIDEPVTEKVIKNKNQKINELINDDIKKIKGLQVELDNFNASNLVHEDKVEGIMSNVNQFVNNIKSVNIENISRLEADSVKRLIT